MQNNTFFFARIVTYVFLFVTFAVGLWYLYPTLRGTETNIITIVYSAPLSLSSTDISLNAVNLALEQRNNRAGGFDVVLKVLDDGDVTGNWVEENERSNALVAVSDPTTVAFLGPLNTGAAKISMPILNQAGIVQMSPSNTWPGLTKSGFLPNEPGIFYPTGIQHYVRVAPTDDLQGPAGALWAFELGFKSAYVVNDNDAYGIGIANLFERKARNIGISIVGSKSITPDTTQYQAVGDEIIASGAELVYYGGITPNGGPELLKYLREKGSTAAFMGPDGIFEQDFIDRAGSASEGVFITAIGAPPEEVKSPTAIAFLTTYKERFNSDPDVFGALTYDATIALLDAIDRADSSDRAAILREVKAIRSQPGVFGTWGFDKNGDTTLTLMSGNIIVNGSFTFDKILKAQ